VISRGRSAAAAFVRRCRHEGRRAPARLSVQPPIRKGSEEAPRRTVQIYAVSDDR
jgi:hypothetical protein